MTLQASGRHHRRSSTFGPFAAARVAVVVALAVLAACSTAGPDTPPPASTVAPKLSAHLPAVTDSVECPKPTVLVDTGDMLRAALSQASPGTVIDMANGVYDGEFLATAVGTPDNPIWLCGGKAAVLRGPGIDTGVVLRLAQAANWRLVGFTVTRGQKGVLADGVTGSILENLAVTDIGDEAVHLRSASSDNVIRGLTISGTGVNTPKFGEGIYVGSAASNWCRISNCEPDRSDRNVIVGNTITDTTAEAVDIKEGTSHGVLRDNVFDGSGLRGAADSWVDVKGNGWSIQFNKGTSAPVSGFQVHAVVPGWGTNNVFEGNFADVRGSGYGIELRPVADNTVTCSNEAIDAARGLTNTSCS